MPMLCCLLSVVIGVVFGLQETSTVETSSKQGALLCGARQAYVMGYSFNFNEMCVSETSKLLFHTKSYSWIPSLALLFGCFIAISQIILSESRGNREISARKRKKARLKTPFKRRSLPYHLVLCCRRRTGNRPIRLSGPSRRVIYLAKQAVKCAKRRRYRKFAILWKYLRIYEACISTPSPVAFRLDVLQDDTKIRAAISKLGPGGVPWDLIENFGLSSPVPDPQDTVALLARAYAVGRLYQSIPTGNVYTTPLVFDTGDSMGLTPFRSDFIDYQPADVSIKAVASTGKVVGIGTVLRKFKSRCGTTVYVPSVNFHMPAADIRLESPQSAIRMLGGDGKAILKHDTIEWILPTSTAPTVNSEIPSSN